ncbi:MAG: PAS domain S-box protein, partial [Acidobacteria bacterium]
MGIQPDPDRLRALEIEDLRRQLEDAQDALRAIRSGEVDALVVETRDGDRVFALENAYELYRVFVENMQEGAAALTPDGLVLYANQRLADITGVPHARLLGASIYQILGEGHRSLINALLGNVVTGLRESEIVLTRSDGRTVQTYFSVTVMPDGTRCAVVTDLTDRVRMRDILASRDLLHVTLTSIGDAVLSCDVEGNITFLNPVAEALTGWSEQEARGRPITQVFRIVNELTHEPAEDLVARVLREGQAVTLANHTALVRRDGREVPIEDSAAPIRDAAGTLAGVVLVFHDVTQRRTAQRALAESQAKLENVLNSISNGFYALDADWRFVAANRVAEQHFGRPASELLGKNIWETTGAGPDSIQYRSFVEASGTRAAVHFEARSTFRPEYWSELHVYPRDGGVEVYFSDISERKKAEESLKLALIDLEAAKLSAERAKAAAEEASHAKDHFLAVLSHELRTPLSPVLTGVSLLDADDSLSPRARGVVDVIRRNVELEARLIDDLLDLTRVARGKIQMNKQTVEVSTVISGAVEVCRPDIDARRLHFGVDFGHKAGRFLVEGDAARLQQVVWNLLKHAIKFTSKGGCVGVLCRKEGGQVVVEVSDSGIGIEPAMIPRV